MGWVCWSTLLTVLGCVQSAKPWPMSPLTWKNAQTTALLTKAENLKNKIIAQNVHLSLSAPHKKTQQLQPHAHVSQCMSLSNGILFLNKKRLC